MPRNCFGLSVCGVDHIETVRRTRPVCGFVGSEYTSQTRTSTRERKCCVPLCSIGLVCGANSRRRHCLTLSSSLSANCCASCGLTILKLKVRTGRTKAKEQKPSCLDDCNGGHPVQENCMLRGFGFELSHDVLLRADWGAQYSQTLTIHRQIEITFPDGGHLL